MPSSHLHPEHSVRGRSPSPRRRGSMSPPDGRPDGCRSPYLRGRSPSPSPRRVLADAVSDVVDMVKYETSRRGRARGEYESSASVSYHDPDLSRLPLSRVVDFLLSYFYFSDSTSTSSLYIGEIIIDRFLPVLVCSRLARR